MAGIYGGFLLGVRSVSGLAFYDWDNTELIRRIEIQPKHVSFASAAFDKGWVLEIGGWPGVVPAPLSWGHSEARTLVFEGGSKQRVLSNPRCCASF